MKVRTGPLPMNPYPYHDAANSILHHLTRAHSSHVTALRDMLRDNPADLLDYVETWIAEPTEERQARNAEAAAKREQFRRDNAGSVGVGGKGL
jgi:hypothetical protein